MKDREGKKEMKKKREKHLQNKHTDTTAKSRR